MAKFCPILNRIVVYMTCLECDDKQCEKQATLSKTENTTKKHVFITLFNKHSMTKTNQRGVYATPEIRLCKVGIEAGFALSLPNSIEDWNRDDNQLDFQ